MSAFEDSSLDQVSVSAFVYLDGSSAFVGRVPSPFPESIGKGEVPAAAESLDATGGIMGVNGGASDTNFLT